jgi:hypothetical protein
MLDHLATMQKSQRSVHVFKNRLNGQHDDWTMAHCNYLKELESVETGSEGDKFIIRK